jgi:hypothetical protein
MPVQVCSNDSRYLLSEPVIVVRKRRAWEIGG